MPPLRKLFRMRNGHGLSLNKLTRTSPPEGINFVGRAAENNGVTARVLPPHGITLGQRGELTVALSGQGGVLSTFVQPEPFVCGFHIAILTPIDDSMTFNEKIWWARCIYANRYRYSFGRQANRSLMTLMLPDDVPNFVNEIPAPETSEAVGRAVQEAIPLPSIAHWRKWRLADLFDIKKGKRLIARECEPGKTPFVGTSTHGNGIVGFIEGEPMFPGGSISVPYNGQGGVGYAFYQPNPFSASDDVQVLVPRSNIDTSALLFVCVILRHERYRYSFGRKWHLERMQRTVISLPAKRNEVDWESMSRFMRGLPFSAAALKE